MASPDEFTGPATELLQSLIRNACVNDGSPESGEEVRNADVLQTFLEGTGLDVERYTAAPGRDSLVCRIEGTDPDAPSLCLMGHTDVVPVNRDGWSRDPFDAGIRDGRIYGLGTADMKSFLAVALLAASQFRSSQLKAPLTILGTADEESTMSGARALAETGGPLGRFAVIGEPTDLRPVNAHKGIVMEGIRLTGQSGHSSNPAPSSISTNLGTMIPAIRSPSDRIQTR